MMSDVDCTTQEVYDLREEVKRLRDHILYANKRVTRFEVIDHTARNSLRAIVRHGVNVDLSYQDDGKTLKVFINDN